MRVCGIVRAYISSNVACLTAFIPPFPFFSLEFSTPSKKKKKKKKMIFYLFILTFAFIFYQLFKSPHSTNKKMDRFIGYQNIEYEDYDYIVVGAGSSGCSLAHNLVKEGGFSVLLLENGNESQNEERVSSKHSDWINNLYSDIDYGFFTTKQKNVNERELPVNRGTKKKNSFSFLIFF